MSDTKFGIINEQYFWMEGNKRRVEKRGGGWFNSRYLNVF